MAKKKAVKKRVVKKTSKKKKKPVKKSAKKKVSKKKVSKEKKVAVAKPKVVDPDKAVYKTRPLPKMFMLVGILFLAVSVVYTISGKFSFTWGFLGMLFGLILVISSLYSMRPKVVVPA
ncbi:hypothetical protein KY330_01170 [Candidatus Woesearchaeota archaeon]|nr:hypothetical protein [Candidatus Woesearchaeota archaeon]